MNYYYHSSLKNYTIALLDMFSDIRVPRFNSNGEKIADYVIPIKFGTRDKAFILSDHDIENLHTGNVNILPRMVLNFESMSKAPERDTNKNAKINKRKMGSDPASLIYEYHYNSVAYDFNFNIFIATRTFTDATIIIEQIAPMFRPDITIKIQELDIQDEPTSVPVSIGDFSITLPEDMQDEDIRIIEVEIPLVLKGNLYLPIKDMGVIKEIEVNMKIIEAKRTRASELYGIDSETEVQASKMTTSTKEELYPVDKDDIKRAQDDSKTVIQHYRNSGDKFPEFEENE